jgi:hypothetical protein
MNVDIAAAFGRWHHVEIGISPDDRGSMILKEVDNILTAVWCQHTKTCSTSALNHCESLCAVLTKINVRMSQQTMRCEVMHYCFLVLVCGTIL